MRPHSGRDGCDGDMLMSDDAIEREIFIEANVDHVWSLVSKAGFWIGDELHFEARAKDGETEIVETADYGSFPVRVERLDAPRYAAYRWASAFPGAELSDATSTLVEFTLTEQNGGVLVRVRESGFAKIEGTASFRDTNRTRNGAGWEMQMERLRVEAARIAMP